MGGARVTAPSRWDAPACRSCGRALGRGHWPGCRQLRRERWALVAGAAACLVLTLVLVLVAR